MKIVIITLCENLRHLNIFDTLLIVIFEPTPLSLSCMKLRINSWERCDDSVSPTRVRASKAQD